MKKYLALLALPIVVFAACNKETADTAKADLKGTWELRAAASAMLPERQFTEGNGNTLRFSDTDYAIYESGQLKKKGTYTVSADTTVSQNVCLALSASAFPQSITFDNSANASKTFFRISGNVLTVISGCYALDAGHSERYVKISDDPGQF